MHNDGWRLGTQILTRFLFMAIPIHSTHTALRRPLLVALGALRPRVMELLVRAILLLDASVWEPASLSERRAASPVVQPGWPAA